MDICAHEAGQDAPSRTSQGRPAPSRRLLVAVPFYKNAHLVEPLIDSLIACAEEMREASARAVFYVDSPGHAPLAEALERMAPLAAAHFDCRIEVNATNMGFVRTMNRAVAEAAAGGMDLLVLNSDTVVEPGALRDMTAALAIDHMIGFVNPRSNNATLTTLPVPPRADRAAWRAASRALAERLPPISYIPTAVGFCLLIRWNILAEFGGFDEIYGQGYNEENDLVMRAGRCGYRAVMANRAFVWHEGEESFATAETDRSVLEPVNRAILDARYPEYGGYAAAYYHSPEATAETLLAQLVPDAEGCLDIGLDFSSFRAAYNGTYQAGHQLLEAACVWGPKYRLHVICSREVYDFHGYAALGVPHSETHAGRRFAAVFRVGQPYDWNVVQRLAVMAPVIGIYMLDTISIDCPQLASGRLFNIWQFALDHADMIATQSTQTQAQLAARFHLSGHAVVIVAPHSRALADYRLPVPATAPAATDDRPTILVTGNHFHHKYLSQTANALAAGLPGCEIVALGLARPAGRAAADPALPPPLAALPNLTALAGGDLSAAELGAHYAACEAVVFPSHAEGFGFPLLNALAAERPVFVRRLPVFIEQWEALGRTANIHFYDATADLLAALASPPAWVAEPPRMQDQDGGAQAGARQIRHAVEAAIAGADHARIVRRVRAMQLASDLSDSGAPSRHSTQAGEAAQFVAQGIERLARRALSVMPVYRGARLVFRTARSGWRAVRGRRA